jgi:hypothetical protein
LTPPFAAADLFDQQKWEICEIPPKQWILFVRFPIELAAAISHFFAP